MSFLSLQFLKKGQGNPVRNVWKKKTRLLQCRGRVKRTSEYLPTQPSEQKGAFAFSHPTKFSCTLLPSQTTTRKCKRCGLAELSRCFPNSMFRQRGCLKFWMLNGTLALLRLHEPRSRGRRCVDLHVAKHCRRDCRTHYNAWHVFYFRICPRPLLPSSSPPPPHPTPPPFPRKKGLF